MANPGSGDLARKPTFSELFTPKLVTVLREGYGAAGLKTDALAGMTVAIVALPLSMAIAIGAGAKPENGLYTAVVGGFLISALGGSRFQIGGPAGAFIVLMGTIIERFGLSGLFMATIMAGFLMLAAGYLRLGAYVKYIPHPVTVGFTAGIGVIIFAGEIKDHFGLTLDHEPGPLIPKLAALAHAAPTINLWATGVTALCLGLILGLKRRNPAFPGLLIAVGAAALLTFIFDLPVETIGSKFGGVPRSLPWPHLPDFPLSDIPELIPSAVAIAVLGSIESLLSAVVADGMTGRRHRSNCELVAQGYANIASAFFGGVCATGTIARTATNVRAHAKGPASGMLHAVFLLLFMVIAAPVASYIPLAALAAVLATVAWNMVERSQIALILRHDRGEAVVLLATFLLTVFRDLTEGIAVGVTLGAILFMHRMAQLVPVTSHQHWIEADVGDTGGSEGLCRGRRPTGGRHAGRLRAGSGSRGLCAGHGGGAQAGSRRDRDRSRALKPQKKTAPEGAVPIHPPKLCLARCHQPERLGRLGSIGASGRGAGGVSRTGAGSGAAAVSACGAAATGVSSAAGAMGAGISAWGST